MRPTAFFLIVLGFCYFVLLGMEYQRYIQAQNWISAKAKVEKAINSIPATKFKPNALNRICTLVNWSYVRYHYIIGEGHYDGEQELGPHLTLFDYMVGPVAVRLEPGTEIDVKYNPRNPLESRVGLDVLKPIETLFGTAAAFMGVGLLLLYMNKITESAAKEDEELNKPLEYFEQKRRARK